MEPRQHRSYPENMALPSLLMTAHMHPSVITGLDQTFVVHRLWEQDDPASFLAKHASSIRGIATRTLYGRVDDTLFAQLPALEIVSSFGVGYDNVDTQAAAPRGIVVTNTPGVLNDEVADFTMGLLLATIRRLPQAERFLREGGWTEGNFPLSPTLRGRQVGILGLGAIGKAVARRLRRSMLP